MPCNCQNLPIDGRWHRASLGADRTPCEISLQERGGQLVGFARVYLPERKEPVIVWNRVDLNALEEELQARAEDKVDSESGAEIGGRRRRRKRRARRKARRRRIFGKLKKAARKVGKNKIVRKIAKGVKKVVNNPLFKAAISVTPMGAAFTAATTAAKIAKKAIKGGKKAKNLIKRTHQAFKRGNPAAGRAMRLFRHGARQLRGSRLAAQMSGDGSEAELNDQFVAGCIGGDVVPGAPDLTDVEAEFVVGFAGEPMFREARLMLPRVLPHGPRAAHALTEGPRRLGR